MMFTSRTSSCFQLRWTQWVVDNVDPLIQVHFHAGSLVLEGLMEARKVAYCHNKDAAASHFDVFSTTEQLFFQVKNSGNFTFGPNSLCF